MLVEVGGLARDCIGEDAELVVRVHRRMAEARRPERVVFVPEPSAWTEVPEVRRVLAAQRRRWHRGLTEIMQRHRRMIGNPRYGAVGVLALPWFLVFELVAPFVELLGYLYLVGVGVVWALQAGGVVESGLVEPRLALLLLAVSLGYSLLLTIAALVLEEFGFHRHRGRRDLLTALAAALLENLGYRQHTAWWRVQGALQGLRGTVPEWGTMTRTGFRTEPERSTPSR